MKMWTNRSYRWKPLGLMLLWLLFGLSSLSQDSRLLYEIRRKGEKVGVLTFHQNKAGATTTYHIESEVKVQVLVTVVVKAHEKSVFENDVLQSSSLLRRINGKEKTNKTIRNNGSGLTVVEEGKEQNLKNFRVKYSTHCLYTTEPVSYTNVFSDNYKKFIPIEKLASGHYKLTFPDGNTNEYFYKNGICQRVKVANQLFHAEFVLNPR